jgi:hypothetical protein
MRRYDDEEEYETYSERLKRMEGNNNEEKI